LGWILFELATHPDEQRRLRDEIYSVQAADDLDDTATVNFDELPFLNAVIKVNLPHVYLKYLMSGTATPTFRRQYVSIPWFRTFSVWRHATR
jgi:Cytochrome P450